MSDEPLQAEVGVTENLTARMARVEEQIDAFAVLMDARFVTHRTLLDSNAAQVSIALEAADKAILKAEAATEKRFDGVNEFRAQLAEQARSFVSAELFNSQFEQSRIDRSHLREDINALRLEMASRITTADLEAAKNVAILKAEDLQDRIDTIKQAQSRTMGVAVGASFAISLISTLVAVVFRLASGH
jgi:hypothetical protein